VLASCKSSISTIFSFSFSNKIFFSCCIFSSICDDDIEDNDERDDEDDDEDDDKDDDEDDNEDNNEDEGDGERDGDDEGEGDGGDDGIGDGGEGDGGEDLLDLLFLFAVYVVVGGEGFGGGVLVLFSVTLVVFSFLLLASSNGAGEPMALPPEVPAAAETSGRGSYT
jgi:hypothetical protein